MKIFRLNPKKSKAQAMVEFALALPILLLVVYGLIETGRLLFIFISVNNATRQAVRYGSTSGIGPNGVARYLDCNGIRAEAQRLDFLNNFNDANINITYNNGLTDTAVGNCNGASYSGTTLATGNRIKVEITSQFNALLPKLVPFISRPIVANSSRTLLLTLTIVQNLNPTTTTITTSPNPSSPGQSVTVTVNVIDNNGALTPDGTVTISGQDSGCSSPITLSGGTASCTVVFDTPGSKTVSATFTPSDPSISDPSSGSGSHQVLADTVTTLTINPNPSPVGINNNVVISVTVTSSYGTPDGNVNITGPDTNCSITLNNGTGSCTVTYSTSGERLITANYLGSSAYRPSSDTEFLDVLEPLQTILRFLSDSPDPSEVNQAVVVNFAVSALQTPIGTVVITADGLTCTVNLTAASGGRGNCSFTFTSLGNKTFTGTFTPTDPTAMNGSTRTENHAVALAQTTTSITAHTPNPSDIGQAVTVTVSVTGGSTIPSGTVTVSDGAVSCATPITLNASGTGSCTLALTTSGLRTLTATYSGDSRHAASNGTVSHTVSDPPIANCSQIIADNVNSKFTLVNGNLTIGIVNSLPTALQIADVTVTWYQDKGAQTGQDKSLILKTASLGSTTFWTGSEPTDPVTIIPSAATYLPASATTTMTFTYQQAQRLFDDESVTINFSTRGCEGVTLILNKH